jgi:hypothetical protein
VKVVGEPFRVKTRYEGKIFTWLDYLILTFTGIGLYAAKTFLRASRLRIEQEEQDEGRNRKHYVHLTAKKKTTAT